MRALLSTPNVDPISVDYPKGRVRDKAGATPGTSGGEVLFGDIIQLFQKCVLDAGIVENGLPDNETNGYQLLEALMQYSDVEEKTVGDITTKLFRKGKVVYGKISASASTNIGVGSALNLGDAFSSNFRPSKRIITNIIGLRSVDTNPFVDVFTPLLVDISGIISVTTFADAYIIATEDISFSYIID